MNWRQWRIGVVVAICALGLAGIGWCGVVRADDNPALHASVVGISSETLVAAQPAIVASPEMALVRVMVAPGAAIPTHEHTGTQIASFISGELTYTVLSGEVDLSRYGTVSAAGAMQRLGPGDTVVLRSGDAIVEHPGSFHQAVNKGHDPVLLFSSILYPSAGKPTIYGTPMATPAT
ncbi:MAG TPA: cupin domain-containing protein [Thermomicrobiales bacterium]|nr:cupin domain-containing protein [Thermomicrobiales bacterium]